MERKSTKSKHSNFKNSLVIPLQMKGLGKRGAGCLMGLESDIGMIRKFLRWIGGDGEKTM